MKERDLAAAGRALAAIPSFAPDAVRDARISFLPGLTNDVYKVETESDRFCLRLPGGGAARMIDRRAEAVHARAAADAGVGPKVLYFGADGVMLTRFIDEAVTLPPAAFRERPGAVERVASQLRALHESARSFTRSFEAFPTIRRYAQILRGSRADLPAELAPAMSLADVVETSLALRPVEQRPCHCDPTGGNLLDTGRRVWIIDWEYSAQNDPLWDVAHLSVEGGFDEALDGRLNAAYFGRAPSPAELGRIVLHKAIADLISGLWSFIQEQETSAMADFRSYALLRLRRSNQRMHSPEFTSALRAVRVG